MVLMCIFLVSPMISGDNRYRMSYVINSTASGKWSYLRRNILISSAYGIFAALLWIIPYAGTINTYYVSGGLGASLRSITDFMDFPMNVTVGQYVLLICVLRVIFCAVAALVMLWVSSRCRNSTSAILINFAIFALPIIIYLLGAEFMVYIGFNSLFSANVLLNEPAVVEWIIPVSVIIVMTSLNKHRVK